MLGKERAGAFCALCRGQPGRIGSLYLLETGVLHLTADDDDAPANWACGRASSSDHVRLTGARRSQFFSNHQTDSSIMAKLIKIAKIKGVPPG